MRYTQAIMAAAMVLANGATTSHASEIKPILVSDGSCGWYVVLGCGKRVSDQKKKLGNLGGANAGGGAGLRVITTNDYANFRPGYYCVVDGPYPSQGEAESIAWTEAVPDAYVKNGC